MSADKQSSVSDVIPTIALVGRPNVGKSTLFNQLTRSRDALVADFPGLTRDRQFGRGQIDNRPFVVIDTGGLSFVNEGVDALMAEQTRRALEECDYVFFLVDAHDGLTGTDIDIARDLRRLEKSVTLVVNKTDGKDPDMVTAEFYQLGLGEPFPISASQGRNVRKLVASVLPVPETMAEDEVEAEEEEQDKTIRIAVIGRPNVGKSTLINRIIGEERVVAFDLPGTTRDSIDVPFEVDGQSYVLIDTAGVRRRGKVKEAVEKFSVIKAIQAIESSHVVILVTDAREDIVDQDVSLMSYALEAGRSVIIAINKWDGLDREQKDLVRNGLDRKLSFVDYAERFFISALHGTGVGHLLDAVRQAYESAMIDMKTADLTRILESAVAAHAPPLVRGRRVKLRYAHQGGRNPPLIVIHGNQTADLSKDYHRYLVNYFRKKLKLVGTPVRIEYRTSDNPYKGRKNPVSQRQKKRRQRLMKFVKRKK